MATPYTMYLAPTQVKEELPPYQVRGLGQGILDDIGSSRTAVLIIVGVLVAFLVLRILFPRKGAGPRAILTIT